MQGKEGERSRRGKGSHGGAKVAAIFFFWVILIFAYLSFSSTAAKVLDRNGPLYRQSPPRKGRFVDTKTALFHAPISPANNINGASDPDILYGDDKRLVHTVNAGKGILRGKKEKKKGKYGEASVNALVSFAVVLLLCLAVASFFL